MKRYKKLIVLGLGLIVLSTLAFVNVVNAQNFKAGDVITVESNQTIDGMLFAAGNNINITGIVDGDVYCAGQTVTISGTIKGDVICAGQTVTISGKIEGNVRIAGQVVTINGTIGNSATIGSQDLIIDKSGTIGRDLLGGSQNTTINGTIGRDIVAGSKILAIGGKITRNINGGIETILVGSAGYVGGYVDYIGNNNPTIIDGGKIIGKVTRTMPENKKETQMFFSPLIFTFSWFFYVLIAGITLALTLVGLFPRIFVESSAKAMKAPGKTALVGFIAGIIAPFIIMILMMTFIGIPLAILAIMIWIIIMILNVPFTSYLLGNTIMQKSKKPIWIMLTGSITLTITYFIPIVGFIALIGTSLFGTGMILIEGKKLLLSKNVK